MRRIIVILTVILMAKTGLYGQLMDNQVLFTQKDTLRGALRPERTCFDVTYYNLTVDVNIGAKSIKGSNDMHFTAVEDFTILQIDLFQNLNITSITWKGKILEFKRQFDAVFVQFPSTIKKGDKEIITIAYEGYPQIAKNAPWDGGFSFDTDINGNPWVGISCEGLGASVWWPNKDHLSDEPDSMMINGIVPMDLMCVANGNLIATEQLAGNKMKYSWKVSYPINNYNVSLNIGKYVHFSDVYTQTNGKDLALDYYVLDYNLEVAKKQFEQVKPMMACYEKYLGPYPFYKDGFAMVETPYLGMEHQSVIAYGNKYQTGYLGFDFSGIGLDFDYIIIHETGHEWWGNNVSMKDLADMWIHEGFCTYSESIYVECLYGNETALDYINASKRSISNDRPIIGLYNVNSEGSGDMYQKGAVFLNTLRYQVNNDPLWWNIILGIQKDFAKQTVTTAQIENYISRKAGKDFSKLFDQYLRHANIPVLEYKFQRTSAGLEVNFRWDADVAGFDMPIRYISKGGKPVWVNPTTEWQQLNIEGLDEKTFKWDTRHFYFTEKLVKS
ncbi:MAG TPA: M1 family metallopeptidase [Chitinophagales bacterium]|nr:M1 family metallopeptidase [Chitinophagales bacterium]HRG86279.1 M1 family metallopeptidase [Chitinophagales bacterium]HRH54343.1 M1 family metallopeptidase [Chitinophagales bacterium]